MSESTLVSLFTSFLPILVTVLFAWLSGRNEPARRRSILEDAKSRIEFIDLYVIAQERAIGGSPEFEETKKWAAQELIEIKQTVNKELLHLGSPSARSNKTILRFFLFYKMRTGRAVLFRTLFYGTLLVSVFWSTLMTDVTFGTPSITGYDPVIGVLALILLIMPLLGFVFLFRWLAIKYDRPLIPDEQP